MLKPASSLPFASGASAAVNTDLLRGLTAVTAIGAGLVGGVFFAFSTFVMKGLRDAPPVDGLRVMQSINLAAPSPLFMGALFGTGLACAALAVASWKDLGEPAANLRLLACGCYVVVLGTTIGYHVPHNDALALVDPNGPSAAAAWKDYAGPWTSLNHVRTVGSLAAAAALTWAARIG
jgi:uncharacterized membrane protein